MRHNFENYFVAPKEYFSGQHVHVNTIIVAEYVAEERITLKLYVGVYSQNIRPPLWSSGQSSWLQIQRSGFHSRRYNIF
jgi:hypothetical protein